jgi:hemoglobin
MKKIFLVVLLLTSMALADAKKSLYTRLGGYDTIAAVLDDFHVRLKNDPKLGRFWKYRGTDGKKRELQLLVDFVCAQTGGPMHYSGRDMGLTHIGMMISESDWDIFIEHLKQTLKKFKVKEPEFNEVMSFIQTLKSSMVEVKE